MNITEQELDAQLHHFGHKRAHDLKFQLQHHHYYQKGFVTSLILAIGSRETNLANIVGDGGHGRGWLQIDDRFNAHWLSVVRGCPDGWWDFRHGDESRALTPGYVPGFEDSIVHACHELDSDAAFCRAHGLDRHINPIHFAIAAYNGGPTGALNGFVYHGNVDKWTTGEDYSADVLQRQWYIRNFLRKQWGFK